MEIEGVLSMEYKDGRQKLVAFFSKSLNKIKRNYEIYDKKMLVVIRKLENWRHLLENAKFKFEVWIYKNTKQQTLFLFYFIFIFNFF